jgi:transposase InsO family protein
MQVYNVGAPFERIAIDIMGPLPRPDSGNRYILVVMDYFTKWPEAYPLQDQEAETVAESLVTQFVSRYKVPLQLHSDQGSNFESALFGHMCKLLGIHKTRTTALYPQSDGMVERFNRTMAQHLAIFIEKNQKDWDRHLPFLLMAYRSATHESTGFTPASMLFGRELRLPCDLLFGRPEETQRSPSQYVDGLSDRLDNVHRWARGKIFIASEKMKAHYDTRCNEAKFKEGDYVWLFNPQRKKGLSPKLQKAWEGPYKVLKRLNDVVYRIQRSPWARPKVVNLHRLAPYHGSPPEGTLA